MPCFKIDTNVAMTPEQELDLARKASSLGARLTGKDEARVLVFVRGNQTATYGGLTDPAAFCEFKSIGLPEDDCNECAKEICALLEAELGIPTTRTLIEFKDLLRARTGWGGKSLNT